MAIAAASRPWRRALSSGRPRLGRQHRLGACRSLPAADRFPYRAVPAAPQRLQSRPANARWRSGAPLAASQCVSRAERGDVVLADDAKWLRERLAANGVPAAAIERHLEVLGNKAAMEAALAWYRARGAIRGAARPDPGAHALHLGRCRRHRRTDRGRRHGRFRRRALSLPRPAGRRPFCRRPGAGPRQRVAAATPRGVSTVTRLSLYKSIAVHFRTACKSMRTSLRRSSNIRECP